MKDLKAMVTRMAIDLCLGRRRVTATVIQIYQTAKDTDAPTMPQAPDLVPGSTDDVY